MKSIRWLFISKRRLIERLVSLESYVGAEYKAVHGSDYTYYGHEPNREQWVKNPIAKLIIEEENKK